MNADRYLGRLRDLLRRRGLPRRYIARYLDELADHVHDLHSQKELVMGTDAGLSKLEQQLGSSEQLADLAAAEYRRRTFAGRHPWWTFAAAPVPLLLLICAAYMAILAGIAALLGGPTITSHHQLEQAFIWLVNGVAYIPVACVAWIMCRAAVRSGLGWKSYLPACLLLSLVAGILFVNCTTSDVPGQSSLTIGFAFGQSMPFQPLQALVPLCIAAAVACYHRGERDVDSQAAVPS